jgi:Zn-dependent M28 family amino/carboxypeptidase
LKALGFANVHAEPFAKPSWARGAESAEVVAPFPQKLAVIGLGGSVPTPPQGIEAPIVVLKSYADLLAARPGAFKGKIVVINQPMARTQDASGYGKAVVARYGAFEAAKRGAVAYLVRSISTSNSRAPHTGGGTYGPNKAKIPEAALGVPDADLLAHMAARGPVRLRLKLASFVRPKSVAWNVSGEIVGSVKPHEVIVIGGHLDSWDPGTGAIDDGAGVAITTAAARLIGQLPRHPRRTIRVVMWGSEETGGSSDAYPAAHKNELARIVVAAEGDLGSDRVYRLKLPPDAPEQPALKSLAGVLAPLKIFISPEPPKDAGSDVEGLRKAGVPVFSLDQDASRYFDIHHSADDTLAVVDRAQLNQNVAAWTALLYLIADSDVDFRAKRAPKSVP